MDVDGDPRSDATDLASVKSSRPRPKSKKDRASRAKSAKNTEPMSATLPSNTTNTDPDLDPDTDPDPDPASATSDIIASRARSRSRSGRSKSAKKRKQKRDSQMQLQRQQQQQQQQQLQPETETNMQRISALHRVRPDWDIALLKIRNRSYYYRNIRLFGLGPMRFFSVDYNDHSGVWEMRFLNVLPFETAKEAIRAKFSRDYVPAPYAEDKLRALDTSLGTAPAMRNGLQIVYKAMSERDAPPKKVYGLSTDVIDPTTHLQTHFAVSIVSTKFAGISLFERMALIHEALLAAVEQDQGDEIDNATQWRGFGTVGPAVRALPQFRYTRCRIVAMLAMTPHEYDPEKPHAPEEHPYGRSRLEVCLCVCGWVRTDMDIALQ